MHPHDVWVARLETNLPQAALADDLILQASATQTVVESSQVPRQHKNAPGNCTVGVSPVPPRKAPPPDRPNRRRNDLALYTVLALAALGTAARRLRRPALRLAQPSPARTSH